MGELLGLWLAVALPTCAGPSESKDEPDDRPTDTQCVVVIDIGTCCAPLMGATTDEVREDACLVEVGSIPNAEDYYYGGNDCLPENQCGVADCIPWELRGAGSYQAVRRRGKCVLEGLVEPDSGAAAMPATAGEEEQSPVAPEPCAEIVCEGSLSPLELREEDGGLSGSCICTRGRTAR